MKRLLLILLFSAVACAQQTSAIDSGGSTLSYRVFGDGTPVLIINGGPGMNSDGFVSLAEKLAKNNRVIIYDQRGTGKSQISKIDSTTITMDLMILDIENLRKHLGYQKWVVLGHSFGGMLASYYATLHPQQIEKLILSSSGGIDLELLDYVGKRTNEKLTQLQRDSLAYWNRQIESGDTSYKARIGRGRALAPAYVYDKKFVPVIAERLTQGNSVLNGLLWQDMQRINFNCAKKLRNFMKPTLIISGKNDILDIKTAEKTHAAISNSRLVLLENCGHYGWLDRETDYFTAVDEFLNRR